MSCVQEMLSPFEGQDNYISVTGIFVHMTVVIHAHTLLFYTHFHILIHT